MSDDLSPMCAARSKLAVPAKPSSYFICTQDADHKPPHTACDGQGHVLARWQTARGKIEAFGPWGRVMV